ncbi:hypothetical protein SF12_01630, partial [Streptomyces sp. MBRL 601]
MAELVQVGPGGLATQGAGQGGRGFAVRVEHPELVGAQGVGRGEAPLGQVVVEDGRHHRGGAVEDAGHGEPLRPGRG